MITCPYLNSKLVTLLKNFVPDKNTIRPLAEFAKFSRFLINQQEIYSARSLSCFFDNFFEPSVNALLAFMQNAPALVIVMAFLLAG